MSNMALSPIISCWIEITVIFNLAKFQYCLFCFWSKYRPTSFNLYSWPYTRSIKTKLCDVACLNGGLCIMMVILSLTFMQNSQFQRAAWSCISHIECSERSNTCNLHFMTLMWFTRSLHGKQQVLVIGCLLHFQNTINNKMPERKTQRKSK